MEEEGEGDRRGRKGKAEGREGKGEPS